MNKYKILNTNNNFQLQVNIPTTWDFANRGDLIDDYESIVAKEMVGVPQNFEMARFSRKPIYDSNNELSTSITYKFYFADYTQNTLIPNTLTPTWYNSYELANTFTPEELRTNANSVQKSFFKVDLYVSKDGRTQKNYLTLILNGSLSLPTEVVTSTTTTTYNCSTLLIQVSSKVNSIRYTDCCNKETNINGGGAFFTGELCVLNNSNIVINTTTGTFTIPSVDGTYSSFNGVITFISGCTCIDASGNETNVTTTTTITPTTTTTTTTTIAPTTTTVPACGGGVVCVVGNTGPGGGKVFYVQASGGTFPCGATLTATCKYLEAAPTSGTLAWTETQYVWSGNTNTPIGVTAQGVAIGAGLKNTEAMVAQNNTAGRAGTITRAYRGPNNFSDWYLPSKDELNQMCKWQRGQSWVSDATVCSSGGSMNAGPGASGFSANYYFSSTEWDNTYVNAAWYVGFGDGAQGAPAKANALYVRPVRAFS